MKYTLLSFLTISLFMTGGLQAQQILQQAPAAVKAVQAPATQQLGTGMEASIGQPAESMKPTFGLEKVDGEIQIGSTVYDLQSNSTSCRRISARPDGRIAGVWTQGYEDSDYPGRGTGYNTRVNFAWGEIPDERLESVRTGWPNHMFTASGGEVIVSHSGANDLVTMRRSGPMDQWTQGTIPTATPNGMLWPRAAVGGADGQSIHVIAITTPTALSGVEYQGVDGHILYHRSTDGGANWDIVDLEIDGLGSAFTVASDADAYYIDAVGETVAFAIFNSWDDLLLFKSEDNGSTWEKTIVLDFPLERYEINSGYTIDELPPFDPDQPDSLAIFSNDSFGSLVLDEAGTAHVFFGNMWVQDSDLADAGSTFYPGTDGISYWNETFSDGGTFQTIVGVVDQNGNDTLDVQVGATGLQVGAYFSSLTTMPSAGVDVDGNLYLAYSSIVEGDVSIDDDMQHYRHIYVIASQDGGQTWTEPLDLITEDVVLEPDLVQFVEAVFPTIAQSVDGKVRLIYQQDFRPGLSVRGDEDEAADNFINYIQLDVSELGVVQTEEQVDPGTFEVSLAPNITRDQTLLTYNLDKESLVSTALVNMHGQVVRELSQASLGSGLQQQQLDVSTLPNGVYYLVLRIDNQYTAVELIKQ